MVEAGEAGAAILLVFFGGGIILAINTVLSGGNPSAITESMSELAIPVIILAVIVAIALMIANQK
jgi:hypothetical protein